MFHMPKTKKKIDIEHITNLIYDIKDRELAKKQLETEIEQAKDEIKQTMTDFKLDELTADVFTVRYKPVISTRFDSAALKAKNRKLYDMFLKTSESMKFTIT